MRKTMLIAVWLLAIAGLVALGVCFVANIVQEVRQGVFTYWEEEVIRFVGLAFLLVLVSKGMLALIHRSPGE